MNDLRKYITILENASQDELQKYRDELKYWQNERKKYWPVSAELMAQYRDGSHSISTSYGYLEWLKNGQRHRAGDKPAVITANGTLEWWQNGKRHRDGDLPAIISSDGGLWWMQNGENHRDGDKPAYIGGDGYLEWYKNGQLHRDGDKPAYIHQDDTLEWYQYGQLHRFGGPAKIDGYGDKWFWRGEEVPGNLGYNSNPQELLINYLKKHKGMQRFRVNK